MAGRVDAVIDDRFGRDAAKIGLYERAVKSERNTLQLFDTHGRNECAFDVSADLRYMIAHAKSRR
ncbi:MAG: hypothetical protein JSR78_10395 [Proteobacteria bacterium]|nr:hypothetical protein [Pseudomonadota bacterium]